MMAFRNNECNVNKQHTRLDTLEIINTVVTHAYFTVPLTVTLRPGAAPL